MKLHKTKCQHCGQNIDRSHESIPQPQQMKMILCRAQQYAEQAMDAMESAATSERNIRSSNIGPLFDRVRVDMRALENRIAALEMAITGKTIRTWARRK